LGASWGILARYGLLTGRAGPLVSGPLAPLVRLGRHYG